MKKARAWLDKRGVAYVFHDYKTSGIDRARLERWSKKVGWETLLNKAGTTFRKLPDKDKNGLTEKKAIALMLAQPSMIKRPVLDIDGKLLVGFKPEPTAESVAVVECAPAAAAGLAEVVDASDYPGRRGCRIPARSRPDVQCRQAITSYTAGACKQADVGALRGSSCSNCRSKMAGQARSARWLRHIDGRSTL